MRYVSRLTFWLIGLTLLATACTVRHATPPPTFSREGGWVIAPLGNHTETPQAGARAADIAEALFRTRGITDLRRYQPEGGSEALFENNEARTLADAQAWAKREHARYLITGAVHEWRYKTGLDGEPAVGLVLQITDLTHGKIVWSASGARAGFGRSSLSAVAQSLIADLIKDLQPRG